MARPIGPKSAALLARVQAQSGEAQSDAWRGSPSRGRRAGDSPVHAVAVAQGGPRRASARARGGAEHTGGSASTGGETVSSAAPRACPTARGACPLKNSSGSPPLERRRLRVHRARTATIWRDATLSPLRTLGPALRLADPARVSAREEDRTLRREVRAIFMGSRGAYGSPRIYKALRARGFAVSHRRVERLMREEGPAGARRARVSPHDRHTTLVCATSQPRGTASRDALRSDLGQRSDVCPWR